MNTNDLEIIPDALSQPARITRRSFVKRSGATVIVTVLALHAFRAESLAANNPESYTYTLVLKDISGYGSLGNTGYWAPTPSPIFIQAATFKGDGTHANLQVGYELYVDLELSPAGKKDSKKTSWEFTASIKTAYLQQSDSGKHGKDYQGADESDPTIKLTGKLKNGSELEWKPSQTDPDTASSDGFSLSIKAVSGGFRIEGKFNGQLTYDLETQGVDANGNLTVVHEDVILKPEAEFGATTNVDITLLVTKDE